MIYWFTGQSGYGKTTLAKKLKTFLESEGHSRIFHIDGDNLREMSSNTDFSVKGRRKNIFVAQQMARHMHEQGYTVVVSLVSPFRDMREKFKIETGCLEIYVHSDDCRGKEAFQTEYERPLENFLFIDTTNKDSDESLATIIEYLKLKRGDNFGKKFGIGVVVLGMHRSGTSAVAGALSKAGVFFGDSLLPAEHFNPKGFFEDTDLVATNEEILRTLNSSFKDTEPLSKNWHLSLSVLPLKMHLCNLIEQKYQNVPVFGFKDPRISILLPLYLDIFKEMNLDVRFVVSERSAFEIASSLKERIGYSLADSLKLCKKYKQSIEEHLEGRNYTRIFMNDFVRNPSKSIKNIFSSLGIPLYIDEKSSSAIHEFVDKDLKHHNFIPEDMMLSPILENKDLKEIEAHKVRLEEHVSRLQHEIDMHLENQKYFETHVARLNNTLSHKENRIRFLEEERCSFHEKNMVFQGNADPVLHDLHERLDAIERSLSWRVVHAFQRLLDTVISPRSALRKPYVKLLRLWQKKPRVIDHQQTDRSLAISQSSMSIEQVLSEKISAPQSVDVLFINHEESRTGAPRILFEIAKEVAGKYRVIVISKMKGGMSEEFAEVFQDNLLYPHEILYSRDRHEIARIMLERLRPKLVYVNSVVSYEYAAEAKKLGIPVIFHVHEMASAYEVAIHKESHADFATFADVFIAVSEATKRDLVKVMNIDEAKIRLIHEFIDSDNVWNLAKAYSEDVVEDMLGIRPDESLVVSMGTFDKRKGGDYFVKIAKQIVYLNKKNQSKVKMLWIGRRPRPHDLLAPMFKDYSKYFIHVDETDNPFPYLRRANTFFLSSREDPFPLVVLEAMSLGKPVVTFEKSGGAIEAGRESAIGLKEFSIDNATNVLYKLSLDLEEQNRRGQMAKERQKLYDRKVVLPKIMKEIDEIMVRTKTANIVVSK